MIKKRKRAKKKIVLPDPKILDMCRIALDSIHLIKFEKGLYHIASSGGWIYIRRIVA